MDQAFFHSWAAVGRTMVVGGLAYAILLLFLRVAGKRTLAKMNAFDLVVTVALGSTLATILLNRQVPLSDGAAALATLIGLQFLITWSSIRWRWIRHVVTGDPSLVFYQGDFLSAELRHTRLTEDEIRAAIRAAGLSSIENVHAVVLETDGSISVVRQSEHAGASSLVGVEPRGVHEG